MKTDEKLQLDVMTSIKGDPELRSIAPSVGVTANNGVITLSGQVESYSIKNAIEVAVRRVRGVRFVAFDITVLDANRETESDTQIANAIQQAFADNGDVKTEGIEVKVDDSWVTLRGIVQWDYQKKEAEAIVRKLGQVRGVSNYITLSDEPCDAERITEKISLAFHRNAAADAAAIHVGVLGRKAILTGKVRSWTGKKDAENAAWSSPGITAVDNLLTVEEHDYVQ